MPSQRLSFRYELQEFLFLTFLQRKEKIYADQLWDMISSAKSDFKQALDIIFTSRDAVNKTKYRLVEKHLIDTTREALQTKRADTFPEMCRINNNGEKWWSEKEHQLLDLATQDLKDAYFEAERKVKFNPSISTDDYLIAVSKLLAQLVNNK